MGHQRNVTLCEGCADLNGLMAWAERCGGLKPHPPLPAIPLRHDRGGGPHWLRSASSKALSWLSPLTCGFLVHDAVLEFWHHPSYLVPLAICLGIGVVVAVPVCLLVDAVIVSAMGLSRPSASTSATNK